MGRDNDYNGAGEDLKKEFKNLFKHSKKAIKDFFRGGGRKYKFGSGINGWAPFLTNKNPLYCLLYPKIIVAGIILLTLLFCGVSLYGIIIIILLTIIFFLV